MAAESEVQRRKLNVVEGAVLAGIIALVASNLMLRDAMVRLQSDSTNLSEEMRDLKARLADVPALSLRVTRLEVRQDANIQEVNELRRLKGLE
jgi:Tfp pilus assembly protein PilN